MNHRSEWITPEMAQTALETGTGRGIKIAVIDSGIDLTHPLLRHLRLVDDIAFEVRPGIGATPTSGWGIDKQGHGTAIAGILQRVAPQAQIGSFRILGQPGVDRYMIDAAARLAIERGYHILNLSLGSPIEKVPMEFYKGWIDVAYRHGVHVVSACNNLKFRTAEWPGNFPSVITVNMAKIEGDELLFRWDKPPSDRSPWHLVEFAARGCEVEVAWKDGKIRKETGSSFAAPHVSALLARLLSRHPHLKPPVAKALLQEVALPWQPGFHTFNEN